MACRRASSAFASSAPGLFFTGYRTELSGQMRFDARSIARALAP
jgi:hypothetical protein